ncbi:MAG: adenosylhomocysteinase [Thermoprotei archaeon]|nr:adenosylhomocysteinase [TACK group archaeon]
MPKIKDPSLASRGELKIGWARTRMPVLSLLKSEYGSKKPLQGKRVGAGLHVTKETAVLVEALMSAGASVSVCASNPLSTQDDVAARLVDEGADVYAWKGMNNEEYYWAVNQVLASRPEIILDDGGDLTVAAIASNAQLDGGCEETTTGIIRARALEKQGKLRFPLIAVNDAETKWEFDNVYGTGQSALDGIIRATNILLAGKTVVVSGYGHVGRGIASRARGMGAEVIVTEVSPVNALKARMDGFRVTKMDEAAKIGDLFITATGNKSVITEEHFRLMKDGAVLANAGHFNVEIDVNALEKIAESKREVRDFNVEYDLEGKKLFLLAEGRLINLTAAEGHPSEVMDMSFSNQFLSALYLRDHGHEMKPGVHPVPREQDEQVALLKLRSMGIEIDTLTEEQESYLGGYGEGTS